MHESGINQSFLNINGKKKFNNFKWDADYNGKVANIIFDSNNNGKKKSYNFILDNNDLVNMLNINTNDIPIDKRLNDDFKESGVPLLNPNPMIIELESPPNYVSNYVSQVKKIQEPQIQEPQIQEPQIQEPQIQEPQIQEPQIQEPQNLNNLDFYIPMIVKKQPTRSVISFPKKIKTKRSTRLKPKSHKVYKIYKNSKSIGYLKHKKSSKKSQSSKKSKSSKRTL
jgi:hypothetical protein